MKIYGLMCDNRNSTPCIHWFKNKKIAQSVNDLFSVYFDEVYYINNGKFVQVLNLPDDFEFENSGFVLQDYMNPSKHN